MAIVEQGSGSITTFESAAQKLAQQAFKPAKGNLSKALKVSDDNKLEKIAEADIQREGLILGLMGALVLLYDTLSDTLLYPAFCFL